MHFYVDNFNCDGLVARYWPFRCGIRIRRWLNFSQLRQAGMPERTTVNVARSEMVNSGAGDRLVDHLPQREHIYSASVGRLVD